MNKNCWDKVSNKKWIDRGIWCRQESCSQEDQHCLRNQNSVEGYAKTNQYGWVDDKRSKDYVFSEPSLYS